VILLFIPSGNYKEVTRHCKSPIDLNGPLHSNWVGLPKLVSQPIINKQLVQMTSQTMTLDKTFRGDFERH
jgi:hypothetical protein